MTKRPRSALRPTVDLRQVRGGDGTRIKLENQRIDAGKNESSEKA